MRRNIYCRNWYVHPIGRKKRNVPIVSRVLYCVKRWNNDVHSVSFKANSGLASILVINSVLSPKNFFTLSTLSPPDFSEYLPKIGNMINIKNWTDMLLWLLLECSLLSRIDSGMSQRTSWALIWNQTWGALNRFFKKLFSLILSNICLFSLVGSMLWPL